MGWVLIGVLIVFVSVGSYLRHRALAPNRSPLAHLNYWTVGWAVLLTMLLLSPEARSVAPPVVILFVAFAVSIRAALRELRAPRLMNA